MSFYLTKQAKKDLKIIARYTEKTWGRKQRNIYLKQIDEVFFIISKTPDLGQNCGYIKAGYYKYRLQKHIIFYHHINYPEIEIVRILHASMDIPTHLST